MIKKNENAGRELQRSHDKHGKNDDADRGENAHVKIIARGGLIF